MKIIVILFSCVIAVAQTPVPPVGDDFQVSGIVVDHLTNRPLSHVLVELVKTGKGGGEASALTEADGRFKFLHVPQGKYQLLADKRGQQPQAFHADGPYATAIVVDGKQDTSNIVFPLNTDAMIGGTVLGDDGDPVRGAQVTLFREGVNDGERQTRQEKISNTNSAGQFHFGHLQAGKYYLATQATPWFAQQNTGSQAVYPVTFYGDTTNGAAAQPIVLAEGGAANVQIALHVAPGIHVRLADQAQGVSIFVAGPGGTRIPVTAVRSLVNSYDGPSLSDAGPPQPPPSQLAPGASRGRFYTPGIRNYVRNGGAQMELTNLAAGRYLVAFNAQGMMSSPVRPVDLADGSTLNLEPPVDCSVTGSMIFDGAKSDKDVELYLSGNRRGLMAEVNADGSFKFEHATAGSYAVHLNSPGLMISSVTAKGARIVHDKLEVSSGAAVDLTVHVVATERLTQIEGVAIRDGAGIPGVMVLLVPNNFDHPRLFRRDQSDGDGSFSLRNVEPGRYTLLAIDDGSDLAYKEETVIKPYLAGGVSLSIPLPATDPIKVTVQPRKR